MTLFSPAAALQASPVPLEASRDVQKADREPLPAMRVAPNASTMTLYSPALPHEAARATPHAPTTTLCLPASAPTRPSIRQNATP
jgi:hypothetical protein